MNLVLIVGTCSFFQIDIFLNLVNMGKNKSKSSGPVKGSKKSTSNNDKSFFKIDQGRAMKAKKGKANVKFNKVSKFFVSIFQLKTIFFILKSKIHMQNAHDVNKLNQTLDSIRSSTLSFQKVGFSVNFNMDSLFLFLIEQNKSQFTNPIAKSNEKSMRTNEDLDEAILKMNQL